MHLLECPEGTSLLFYDSEFLKKIGRYTKNFNVDATFQSRPRHCGGSQFLTMISEQFEEVGVVL